MSMEDLESGIEYAHKQEESICGGKRLAHNEDFGPGYLKDLKSIGADGIIVSDLGVLALAARTVLEIPSIEHPGQLPEL